MSLVVIEGLDGSGKSTQVKMLKQFFESKNIPYRYIHFPRPECPFYGELISRFLRGDFGDIDQVDPYLVALIYAGDRFDAKNQIVQWMNEGFLVLLDRYVFSNIAFQCAKMNTDEDVMRLRHWILDLEYNYNALPKPSINIFMDVPDEFTKMQLTSNRDGEDRAYLQGNIDIHEKNLDFQARVRKEYMEVMNLAENSVIINCNENGAMLHPDLIAEKIQLLLKNKKIVS